MHEGLPHGFAHGAKDWFRQTAEGERMYNLPADLAQFMVPPIRAGLQGLGALEPSQRADLQDELDPAYDMHGQAIVLVQEVFRTNPSAYDGLSAEVGAFGIALGNLNVRLTTMNESDIADFRVQVTHIEVELDALVVRLREALRAGQRTGKVQTVVLTAVALILAGGTGWVIWRRSKRR